MGKHRNKNKEKDDYVPRPKHDEEADSDSDESVSTHLTFDDNLSVQGDEEVDSTQLIEALEGHIENASNKNNSVRLAALSHIKMLLITNYLREDVLKWKETLLGLVVKSLRKTDSEVIVAADIAALLAIQLGEELSESLDEVIPLLRNTMADVSLSELVRASCALSLGVCTHLSEVLERDVSLAALRQVWASQKMASTSTRLFGAALSAWGLILLDANNSSVMKAMEDEPKLVTYLDPRQPTQLETRLYAGETLALLYEVVGESFPSHRFANHDHVVEFLQELIKDSTKFRAKKDKRVQRFTFRQIAACVEGDGAPSVCIRFPGEQLQLESCALKLIYDSCCEIMRGGMMRQIKENTLLREIFDMGPVQKQPAQRMTKAQRIMFNAANDKVRNQLRAKQRDKRAC